MDAFMQSITDLGPVPAGLKRRVRTTSFFTELEAQAYTHGINGVVTPYAVTVKGPFHNEERGFWQVALIQLIPASTSS